MGFAQRGNKGKIFTFSFERWAENSLGKLTLPKAVYYNRVYHG
jgi:hypothetical protein